MHVHINWSWCQECNWGGTYDSRYMVSIQKTLTYAHDAPIEKDWGDLVDEHKSFDQEKYDDLKERQKVKPEMYSDDWIQEFSQTPTYRLKS